MQPSEPASRPGPRPEAPSEVVIDGSEGEGGGQILRTSLSLSLRTGTPFRLINVRANRDRPGLRPQHLAAVTAAARLGAAEVSGDRVGSAELRFAPQLHGADLPAGDYRFDIGTAGSAPLVLQTVLPALLGASGPSRVTILGGTYNTKAPPFDFIERVFAPLVCQLGGGLRVRLDSPGFYPAGGGRIYADIEPCPKLGRLELLERGALIARRATAVVARLPGHVAERELATVGEGLGWPVSCLETRELKRCHSPGNIVLIEIKSERITELFSAVGERGLRAEEVAGQAIAEASAYLEADVPVGEHLADQLLMLLALGHGGVYRTTAPSSHTLTQLDIVRRFLPAAKIAISQESPLAFRVEVSAAEQA